MDLGGFWAGMEPEREAAVVLGAKEPARARWCSATEARLTRGLSSRHAGSFRREEQRHRSLSLFYPSEGKGRSAPGARRETCKRTFCWWLRGSGGRWEHLRRKGPGLGEGGTIPKGPARSWPPTFSSEVAGSEVSLNEGHFNRGQGAMSTDGRRGRGQGQDLLRPHHTLKEMVQLQLEGLELARRTFS